MSTKNAKARVAPKKVVSKKSAPALDEEEEVAPVKRAPARKKAQGTPATRMAKAPAVKRAAAKPKASAAEGGEKKRAASRGAAARGTPSPPASTIDELTDDSEEETKPKRTPVKRASTGRAPSAAASKKSKPAPPTKGKAVREFRLLVETIKPAVDPQVIKSGKYTGTSPAQAAGRAFTQLMKKLKVDEGEWTFSIREEGKGTVSSYRGLRTHFEEPQSVTRGGREITVAHKNKVTWLKGGAAAVSSEPATRKRRAPAAKKKPAVKEEEESSEDELTDAEEEESSSDDGAPQVEDEEDSDDDDDISWE